MRRAVATFVLSVAVALVSANPAGAVRIGPDLNAYTANAAYGCETVPSIDWLGGRWYYGSGQSSCTYLASSADINNVPQAQSPGGVLTAVHVRAGAVTGPMQATILRATRSGYGPQCCYHQAESQVFTPAANTITTVPVRLPMRNDTDPSFGETVDYLAITVLQPNVHIPMHDFGAPASFPGQMAAAFFPHVKPGDIRVDSNGIGALQPLVSGEFSPLCAGRAAGVARSARVSATRVSMTGQPVRAAAGSCSPVLETALGKARLRRGRVSLALTCNAGIPCNGTVKLQTKNGAGKTLASSAVNAASGATVTLKPKLTTAGKRLMAGKRKRKVWLNAALALAGGGQVLVTDRVTLRR